MRNALFILVTGIGGTLVADLWTLVRSRLFGTPLPNFAMVGRWIAYLPRGRLRHEAIARTPAVAGERAIGWIAHYLIGIGFAVIPLFVAREWTRSPDIAIALSIGAGTVVAPFFILQPALGAGIAASRMPHPRAARMQSLVYHLFFGLGLYLSAAVVTALTPAA
jgi:Protein of unknown function (DUF2938)